MALVYVAFFISSVYIYYTSIYHFPVVTFGKAFCSIYCADGNMCQINKFCLAVAPKK